MDDAALRAKVPIRICSNSKPIEPYTRVEKIRWEKKNALRMPTYFTFSTLHKPFGPSFYPSGCRLVWR